MKRWMMFSLMAAVLPARTPAAEPGTSVPVVTAISAPTSPAAQALSPEAQFGRLLDESQKAYAAVNDYVTTLVVQERIDGELRPREVGAMKFKAPFSVYIKWFEGPQAGTEVLYVRGQNNGKVLAHKTGLLGIATFRLEPTSRLALLDNRHPITDAGIGQIQTIVESNCKRALAEGKGRARQLADRASLEPAGARWELLVEADKNAGYYCRRAVVTFDPKTHLVVAVQVFDWNNKLVEDYRDLNLRLNVGLTERDFDPENIEYDF